MSDQSSSRQVVWGVCIVTLVIAVVIIINIVNPLPKDAVAETKPLNTAKVATVTNTTPGGYMTASRKSVRVGYCAGVVTATYRWFQAGIAAKGEGVMTSDMRTLYRSMERVVVNNREYAQMAAGLVVSEINAGLPPINLEPIFGAGASHIQNLMERIRRDNDAAAALTMLEDSQQCVSAIPALK